MNKQIITADHLNATHLGKRITINGKHGTVMSGTLKEIRADYAIMPSFTSYFPYKADKPLEYSKDVHIILHLSNQVNGYQSNRTREHGTTGRRRTRGEQLSPHHGTDR